jgi:hypothetical protein
MHKNHFRGIFLVLILLPTLCCSVPAQEHYNLTAQWGGVASGAPGQIQNLYGFATDSAGNLYTVEEYVMRVQKFSPDGKFLSTWGTEGTEPGKLFHPAGIRIDENDMVYILDHEIYWKSRIQKFTTDGKNLSSFSTDEPLFNFDVGKDGNIYANIGGTWRLVKYTNNGRHCNETVPDTTAGNKEVLQFRKIGSDNKLYALYQIYTGNGGSKIEVYDPDGTPIRILGSDNTTDPQYFTAFDVAVDRSGNIIVPDVLSNSVKIFDPDGVLKAQLPGSEHCQPYHVAIDRTGNIFVSEGWVSKGGGPPSGEMRWYIRRFSPVGVPREETTTPATGTAVSPVPSGRPPSTNTALQPGLLMPVAAPVIAGCLFLFMFRKQQRKNG